jgi:hypothetical protein
MHLFDGAIHFLGCDIRTRRGSITSMSTLVARHDGLEPALWTRGMTVAHRLSSAMRGGPPHAIDKYCDLKTIWTAYS